LLEEKASEMFEKIDGRQLLIKEAKINIYDFTTKNQ
jgi:hypothetical protein